MKKLVLPETYEYIQSHFSKSEIDEKIIEFVRPLINTEREISLIASDIKSAGKLVFTLGRAGIGKSTFLNTLKLRSHLSIRKVININANNFLKLDELFIELSQICEREISRNDMGICAIVIDYLESLNNYEDKVVKAFFQRLNGLLRLNPVLILWPVINEDDVNKMIKFSQDVSGGTLFSGDKQIININGPDLKEYVNIAKSTIKVLNGGAELSHFVLSNDIITEIFDDYVESTSEMDRSLRSFYAQIISEWKKNSGYIKELESQIPKETEVWFIFPPKEAESIVDRFVKRGNSIEDEWTIIADQLLTTIKRTKWNAVWTSKRLLMALHWHLKARMMFLPTNLVISACASFSDNEDLKELIKSHSPPGNWSRKAGTKKSIESSPMYKQLIGEQFPFGKRKGGNIIKSLNRAEPIYSDIIKDWLNHGGGNDIHLNKALGKALEYAGIENVKVEKEHPWIKGVKPDIQIEREDKIICMEFHYTTVNTPSKFAHYTLEKLDRYMTQTEYLIKK